MDLDDLKELSGELLSLPGRIPATAEQRPSLRKPSRSDPAILRMRVDLEYAKPSIWRRLDVRSDIGLDVFHQVLQGAFAGRTPTFTVSLSAAVRSTGIPNSSCARTT
jgi:hypothetical protein